jgi:hypothetical protein
LLAPQNVEWMSRLDPDRSGAIELSEFLDAILSYVVAYSTQRVDSGRSSAPVPTHPARSSTGSIEGAEDDEVEEIEVCAVR